MSPVLVLLTSSKCPHCTKLKKNWPQIEKVIKTEFENPPKIIKINFESKVVIDSYRYPSDLQRFCVWFPFLMLIPEDRWNEAIDHLGPYNPVKFNNVAIANGRLNEHNIPVLDEKYAVNLNSPEDIINWLRENYDIHDVSITPLLSNPIVKGSVKYIEDKKKIKKFKLIPRNR